MKLVRWATSISDCDNLYFNSLVDDGQARLIVKNNASEIYEIVIGSYCGPYIVSGEEFLTKYWSLKPSGIGWTFIVEESDLGSYFPGVMDSGDYKHYVISTIDTCLEVLAEKPPLVQRIG